MPLCLKSKVTATCISNIYIYTGAFNSNKTMNWGFCLFTGEWLAVILLTC